MYSLQTGILYSLQTGIMYSLQTGVLYSLQTGIPYSLQTGILYSKKIQSTVASSNSPWFENRWCYSHIIYIRYIHVLSHTWQGSDWQACVCVVGGGEVSVVPTPPAYISIQPNAKCPIYDLAVMGRSSLTSMLSCKCGVLCRDPSSPEHSVFVLEKMASLF